MARVISSGRPSVPGARRDPLDRHPFDAATGRLLEDPWLAIMASIPLVNLIVLYYVAVVPWPRDTLPPPPPADGSKDARF